MSTASGDDYLVAPEVTTLVSVPETRATQWPFAVVSIVGLLGLGLIALGRLYPGIVALTIAVGMAALLRLVLPARTAGWLVSRHRLLDVFLLSALAAGLAATVFLLK